MRNTMVRLGRYTLLRVVAIFLTVVLAVYLTVIIANWGGEMDVIRKRQIEFEETMRLEEEFRDRPLTAEQFQLVLHEAIQRRWAMVGLDKPFALRTVYYLRDGLTLTLGRAEQMRSDLGSNEVKDILLERLPRTLLLMGTAQLLLFFTTLFLALFLSRRYGSWLDRINLTLAPTSAAPAWFFGIFLIVIFAAVLRILPYGGMAHPGLTPGTWEFALSVLQHMVLPVSAIILGAIFGAIYSWRTFFLIYSSEEYVELARAKGLSSRGIERRYILRPTLPPIITSFAFMMISVWMGAIVLETVFNWPGIGLLLWMAMNIPDTPVIVAAVVVYGYLLAATVFLLDFMYAALDPRVRVGLAGKQ